ncbi:MAG: hypothetical protein V1846_04105 [Candidatus Komeilibacteria bacterium]
MKRIASVVRLRQPDWNRIAVVAVWSVFFLGFLVVPMIKGWLDPKTAIHRPFPTDKQYRAVVDSAFTLQAQGLKAGLAYRATDYAHDMFKLRQWQLRVERKTISGSGQMPFQGIVESLRDRALQSERQAFIDRCTEPANRKLCERQADMESWRVVQIAVDDYRRGDETFKPIGGKLILSFCRHFAISNLWTILITALVLVIKLVVKRRFKEEILLSPGRFIWSCFWWAYGVANYPGNDVASEIRFIRLRRQRLNVTGQWELTAHEEAALRFMARDRLMQFDQAIESVRDLGLNALSRPRRTIFVSLLIWLSSGSLVLRSNPAQATVVVEACALAEAGVPQLQPSITVPFTPMGGGDKLSSETSAFMPSLISPEVVRIVCLGAGIPVVDQRKLIRAIRTRDCRAPPVIFQEAHDEANDSRSRAGHGDHGHLLPGAGSAR